MQSDVTSQHLSPTKGPYNRKNRFKTSLKQILAGFKSYILDFLLELIPNLLKTGSKQVSNQFNTQFWLISKSCQNKKSPKPKKSRQELAKVAQMAINCQIWQHCNQTSYNWMVGCSELRYSFCWTKLSPFGNLVTKIATSQKGSETCSLLSTCCQITL